MSEPQFYMRNGETFKPVNIPATGKYQLMRLETVKAYILVNQVGRQAWFHEDDMKQVSLTIPNFRYTAAPMNDLQRLLKAGLRPFHLDADFNHDLPGLTVQ